MPQFNKSADAEVFLFCRFLLFIVELVVLSFSIDCFIASLLLNLTNQKHLIIDKNSSTKKKVEKNIYKYIESDVRLTAFGIESME